MSELDTVRSCTRFSCSRSVIHVSFVYVSVGRQTTHTPTSSINRALVSYHASLVRAQYPAPKKVCNVAALRTYCRLRSDAYADYAANTPPEHISNGTSDAWSVLSRKNSQNKAARINGGFLSWNSFALIPPSPSCTSLPTPSVQQYPLKLLYRCSCNNQYTLTLSDTFHLCLQTMPCIPTVLSSLSTTYSCGHVGS